MTPVVILLVGAVSLVFYDEVISVRRAEGKTVVEVSSTVDSTKLMFGEDGGIAQTIAQSVAQSIEKTSADVLEARRATVQSAVEAHLDALFGDAEYAIEVFDLATDTPITQIRTHKDFISASTYKIFVAYAMLDAIEKGTETWGSELNGTTLQTCMERMIVESDNACPLAWIDRYSYEVLTEQAHAIGASDTTRFAENDKHTTAADLTTALAKLYHGDLLSDASNEHLFTLMKNQNYRDGIPAGIGAAGEVADKVGFLNGLLHDAGIVSSQKGDYVIVIMTDGSSWDTIAQATALLYDAL